MINGLLKTAAAAGLVLLLTAPAALAQIYNGDPAFQRSRPAATSPGYIAMLYHKMLGLVPDFEQWATASRSYGNASQFDKALAQREKAAELRGVYDLLTPSEPIIIELNSQLSDYSHANGGFFIKEIKDDMFFGFDFMDQHYAVIPSNILNYQFIKMSPEQGEKVRRGINDGGTDKGALVFYIEPKFADKSEPLLLEGVPRWLLAGEIMRVAIYRRETDKLLWESEGKNPEPVSQELLDLKQ